MTDRLYYSDSYLRSFTATVAGVTELAGRPALLLDSTAFYPTSGGQPNDTGWLGDAHVTARVVDVVAQDGAVLHVLDAPAPLAPGQAVTGSIDWPRRYDHMQQHSAQHLLSQLCSQLYGFETVSVHFGAEDSTLDLDAAALAPEQLAELESQANELAYTALPITAYLVDEAHLAALPLRRPPKVTGRIRIVEIAGYDYSACGGTHVHTTAEVAPIKLLRMERRRGQTRLTFKAGLRACRDYADRFRLLADTANLFNNEAAVVPGLVQRTLEQNRDLQHQVDVLTEDLMGFEVQDLLAAAAADGAVRVVNQFFPARSVDALKRLAGLLAAQERVAVLLGTAAGGKLTLVFARSADVNVHMGNLLREALKTVGGAGGGRPEFAQGGGVDAVQAGPILHAAATALHSALLLAP